MKSVKDVRAAVRRISQMVDDDEGAHSAEDGLYHDVLQAIADGTAEDPKAMAKEALRTVSIDFHRWCA